MIDEKGSDESGEHIPGRVSERVAGGMGHVPMDQGHCHTEKNLLPVEKKFLPIEKR